MNLRRPLAERGADFELNPSPTFTPTEVQQDQFAEAKHWQRLCQILRSPASVASSTSFRVSRRWFASSLSRMQKEPGVAPLE